VAVFSDPSSEHAGQVIFKAWCSPSGLTTEKLSRLSELGWNAVSTMSQPNISWEMEAANFEFVSNSVWWSVETAFDSNPETRYLIEGSYHALQSALGQSTPDLVPEKPTKIENPVASSPGQVTTNPSTDGVAKPTGSQNDHDEAAPPGTNDSELTLGTNVSFEHKGSPIVGTLVELSDGYVMVKVEGSARLPDNVYKMMVSKVTSL
jgi:hypothetical protein